MRILAGKNYPVKSLQFSRTGQWLLSYGESASEKTQVFHVPSGEIHWSSFEPAKNFYSKILVSGRRHHGVILPPQEDQILVCGYPDGCKLFDLNTAQEIQLPEEKRKVQLSNPIFSPTGDRIFGIAPEFGRSWGETQPENVRLLQRVRWGCWSYPDFQLLESFAIRHTRPAFASNGRVFAFRDNIGVNLHQLTDFSWLKHIRHPNWIINRALFEQMKKPRKVSGSRSESTSLALDPESRFLAASTGEILEIIDAQSGNILSTNVLKGSVFHDLAFTQDGRYLAAVSNRSIVEFFNTETWELEKSIDWRIGSLRSLAFSADGLLAAAGSDQGKIIVWDFEN